MGMGSEFDELFEEEALPTLYEHFGVSAHYISEGSDPVPCTVIIERNLSRFGDEIDIVGVNAMVSVRVSELVERPRRGDRFVIESDGTVYNVDRAMAGNGHEHELLCT